MSRTRGRGFALMANSVNGVGIGMRRPVVRVLSLRILIIHKFHSCECRKLLGSFVSAYDALRDTCSSA